MTTYTSRFGFTDLGAQERQVLDRILESYETHDHSGGVRLADPVSSPTVVLSSTGGALAAGRVYYYSVSLIDQFGLETRASAEVSVTTAAPISAPASPGIEANPTGGTLAGGLYYYALTFIAGTEETQLSTPSLIDIPTTGTAAVILHLPVLDPGADQFRIWRQGPGESGFTKLGITASLTFVDDGSVAADPCACDPGNLPPASNSTSATSSATITLSSLDQARLLDASAKIQRWRLYRSDLSGSYGGASLVHEVVETTSATLGAPLVASWTDTGGTLLDGSPKLRSQTLTPSKALAALGWKIKGTFSSSTGYSAGDVVLQNKIVYVAKVSAAASAFDATQWDVLVPAPAVALDDLTDVATTGATTGQVLTYNGTSWAPATPTAGGGGDGGDTPSGFVYQVEGVWPDRPTATYPLVWVGPTQPPGLINGDVFINNYVAP